MDELALPPALAADMQQVDQIVAERVRSRAAVISVAGADPGGAGRPRLRAALVLLAAAVGAYRTERVIHAAAAVELILAATQAHDRLVDEAGRRRGAAGGEWNHGVALMVGDYLFALAAGEMALSPEPRVITFFSQAVMQISEAALQPVPALAPFAAARAAHLERVGGAAAALYAAACRAGGACGNLPDEQIEALGRYGHSLGLALYLAEEARAFAGPEPLPAGLRRGAVSLPLIVAAQAGDTARLAAAIDGGDPTELLWAAAEVRRLGLEPARAEAARHAAEARAALAPLTPGPPRNALDGLAARAI